MDASPSSVRVSETKAQTESVMTLVEISAGYCLPRALHVVADLAIADALDHEPRSATDLAKEVGVVLMLWTEYCVCSLPMVYSIGAAANNVHKPPSPFFGAAPPPPHKPRTPS